MGWSLPLCCILQINRSSQITGRKPHHLFMEEWERKMVKVWVLSEGEIRPERCIEYTRCIPVITANNTYFFNFACIEYLVIFMFVVVCSALQRPCLCQGYWSVPKSFSLSAYPPEHLRPVRERRISRVFSLSGSAASTLSKLSDWNAEDNKQTRSLQYTVTIYLAC